MSLSVAFFTNRYFFEFSASLQVFSFISLQLVLIYLFLYQTYISVFNLFYVCLSSLSSSFVFLTPTGKTYSGRLLLLLANCQFLTCPHRLESLNGKLQLLLLFLSNSQGKKSTKNICNNIDNIHLA